MGRSRTSNESTFKPFISQWGMDPIWRTAGPLRGSGGRELPRCRGARLRGDAGGSNGADGARARPRRRRRVPPELDEGRGLWFADLTIDTFTDTYMPFVRLALVRYQPSALLDAKISRVVLADFAQLTPDRSAMVTCDPYHPRRLNVVVSGVVPRGPEPGPDRPTTQIRVRVQQRDEALHGDFGWKDAAPETATVAATADGAVADQPDLALWVGGVTFAATPQPGQFRLLVEESELIAPAELPGVGGPRRLIYAETFELDGALLQG